MIRILLLILAVFLTSRLAYAGYTSPANGISTTGNFNLSWQGNPINNGVSPSANWGTPLYKLTEEKLNSGLPPTPVYFPWDASSVSFTGKASGHYIYTYSERICSSSGCWYYTPPDSRIIVTVGSPASAITVPVEAATSIGSTPYFADVNNKGEAVVSIPIDTPEDVGGMHPKVSLNFTSRALDRGQGGLSAVGWLGFGWSLNGVSVINRCTLGKADISVPVSPGNPSAGTTTMRPRLQYDDTDSLCIDGALLSLVAGTHLRVGAQYRTKNESFRLVTMMGTNESPWFEVRNPNGNVSIYGKEVNSKVQKITTILGTTKTPFFTWSIDSETDPFNRQITYTYLTKDEAFSYQPNKQRTYIGSIKYPGASIVFSYMTVTGSTDSLGLVDDGASAGVDRYRFKRDAANQLTKITVSKTVGGPRVYNLIGNDLHPGLVRSVGRRLGGVQECASVEETGQMTCFPPITFQWTYHENLDWHELNTVTDSLGAQTQYGYTASSGCNPRPACAPDTHSFDMPTAGSNPGRSNNVTVVNVMRKSNGLAPGQLHSTAYRYYGNGDDDLGGLGFVGFRATAVVDLATGVSTHRQFQAGSNLTGEPTLKAEHVYSREYGLPGATLLSKTEFRWSVANFTFSNGTKTYFPYISQTTSFNFEAGVSAGVSIKNNTYNLDTSQNVFTSIVSTTTIGSSIDAITFTPYFWSDKAPYVVTASSVKSTTQKTTSLGNVTNSNDWRIGYKTREETNFYNGPIGGAGVDVKTQFKDYTVRAGSTKVETETRFTNDPEYHLQTTYGYDSNGLPSSVTINGVNVESRTETTVYEFGYRIPSSITNAYGHTVSNSNFDRRFNLPRVSTDSNGLVSTYEYDAFGRVQAVTDPNGAVTSENYLSCASNSCDVVAGKLGNVSPVYFKETISHIIPRMREYFDERGRVIRKETAGFIAGEWIRTDFQYDELGREYKISLPYKTGSTPQYSVKSYDERGRITLIQQPDGGSIQTEYAAEIIQGGDTWKKVSVTESVKKSDGSAEPSATGRTVTYFNSADQVVRVFDAQGSAQETITNYAYDALSNIVSTTVNAGSDGLATSTAAYDRAGNRISTNDPNAGAASYKYTAMGELRESTDAKGTVTSYSYDKLGRLRTRSNTLDGSFTWSYDPVGAKGLLSSITNNNGYTETLFYQDANRVARLSRIETSITVPGVPGAATKTFTESFTYDVYGRPQKTTFPSTFAVWENYNAQGYRSSVSRGDNWYGLIYATKMGAFGLEEGTVSGIPFKRSYDSKSGRITGMQVTQGAVKIQDLAYQWYSNGSLQTKTDNKSGSAITDTYTYDAHDRLTAVVTSGNGSRTQSHAYNKLGNVTSNTSTTSADSQVNSFGYTSGRPHAVNSVTINGIAFSLGYDQNGAVTSYDAPGVANDKYISYNSKNQPIVIVAGGTSINDVNATAREEFKYTPEGARYYKKSSYWQGGVLRSEHTYYVGNYETTFYDTNSATFQSEKTTFDELLHIRKTPYVGAVVESQQVLVRDHLGSVTAVWNSTNTIQLAYESFGARRNSSTLDGNISNTQLNDIFSKADLLPSAGFSSHENLDRTGLVHMNGRVYDPQLGRFLSPDPRIQDPLNSQSWNRYSYVFNNPLKFSDPTGYESVPTVVVRGSNGCNEKCQRDKLTQNFLNLFTMAGMKTSANGVVTINKSNFNVNEPNLLNKLVQSTFEVDANMANTIIAVVAEASSKPEGLMQNEDGVYMLNGEPVAMGIAPDPTVIRAGVVKLVTHLHHAWPKYIGGPGKQKLVSLQKEIHQLYHGGLDKILPRQWGTRYYSQLAKKQRDQMIRDFTRYTKAFDEKHGTKLYEAAVKNGLPKVK